MGECDEQTISGQWIQRAPPMYSKLVDSFGALVMQEATRRSDTQLGKENEGRNRIRVTRVDGNEEIVVGHPFE